MDNLVLVGFSCSGKTTVGRAVARRVRMRFVDTDRMVEEAARKSVARIFQEDGEPAFRSLEHVAVEAVCDSSQQVISTGGGAFVDPDNRAALRAGNLVIHLQVRPQTVVERLHTSRSGRPRPLLDSPDPLERVTELMRERDAAYREAHVALSVDDRTTRDLVAELSRRWSGWQRQHHRKPLERLSRA